MMNTPIKGTIKTSIPLQQAAVSIACNNLSGRYYNMQSLWYFGNGIGLRNSKTRFSAFT